MSIDTSKISLYTQGTFDNVATDPEEHVQIAERIGQAGFGTVILGQYHLHADGTIYSNETPLDPMGGLNKVVAALRGTGVQNVTITFGPFGNDFLYIDSNWAEFQKKMEVFVQSIGSNGFDWNVEQDLDDNIVELTERANGFPGSNVVTAAPFDFGTSNFAFWQKILAETNVQGQPGLTWINFQTPYGQNFTDYVKGLNIPETFVVPYFNAGNFDAQTVENSLQSNCQGAVGATLWNYKQIVLRNSEDPLVALESYVHAIQQGPS